MLVLIDFSLVLPPKLLVGKIPLSLSVLQGKTKQEVGDYLTVCTLNVLPVVSTIPSLVVTSLVKVEYKFFKLSRDLATPPEQSSSDYMMKAPHSKSPTWHVWWPQEL